MFVVLVHYFWLFEFKFIFEFICLSPFQKNIKIFLFLLYLSSFFVVSA
jgi:hypothetical protein